MKTEDERHETEVRRSGKASINDAWVTEKSDLRGKTGCYRCLLLGTEGMELS